MYANNGCLILSVFLVRSMDCTQPLSSSICYFHGSDGICKLWCAAEIDRGDCGGLLIVLGVICAVLFISLCIIIFCPAKTWKAFRGKKFLFFALCVFWSCFCMNIGVVWAYTKCVLCFYRKQYLLGAVYYQISDYKSFHCFLAQSGQRYQADGGYHLIFTVSAYSSSKATGFSST